LLFWSCQGSLTWTGPPALPAVPPSLAAKPPRDPGGPRVDRGTKADGSLSGFTTRGETSFFGAFPPYPGSVYHCPPTVPPSAQPSFERASPARFVVPEVWFFFFVSPCFLPPSFFLSCAIGGLSASRNAVFTIPRPPVLSAVFSVVVPPQYFHFSPKTYCLVISRSRAFLWKALEKV